MSKTDNRVSSDSWKKIQGLFQIFKVQKWSFSRYTFFMSNNEITAITNELIYFLNVKTFSMKAEEQINFFKYVYIFLRTWVLLKKFIPMSRGKRITHKIMRNVKVCLLQSTFSLLSLYSSLYTLIIFYNYF